MRHGYSDLPDRRKVGTCMLRIRIGAKVFSSSQLDCIARLSNECGSTMLRVTPDSYLQIHEVKAEALPGVLEALRVVGFSCLDGQVALGNVLACSRAGLCPRERFNVAPYVLAVATYLRSSDSVRSLFQTAKVAFSGCPSDCALAAVADLGFSAQVQEDVRGFSVRVGGGLGPPPAVGVQVDEFVRDSEILPVVESVRRLFERYNNQADPCSVSLRGLLEGMGTDEFIRCYREERARIAAQGLACDILEVAGQESGVQHGKAEDIANGASTTRPEKREGLHILRVRLPGGDISTDDLTRLAQAARSYGTGVVRVTPRCDLLIPGVSHSCLDTARDILRGLDLSL